MPRTNSAFYGSKTDVHLLGGSVLRAITQYYAHIISKLTMKTH